MFIGGIIEEAPRESGFPNICTPYSSSRLAPFHAHELVHILWLSGPNVAFSLGIAGMVLYRGNLGSGQCLFCQCICEMYALHLIRASD
jgi:hypothetical protein